MQSQQQGFPNLGACSLLLFLWARLMRVVRAMPVLSRVMQDHLLEQPSVLSESNTCYLNSALQCFLKSPGVVEALDAHVNQYEGSTLAKCLLRLNSTDQNLGQCLERVLRALEDKHGTLVRSYLHEGLRQQFDSGLFLRSILLPALQAEGVNGVSGLFTLSTARTMVNKASSQRRTQLCDETSFTISAAEPRTSLENAIKNELLPKVSNGTQTSLAVDLLPANLIINVEYLNDGFLMLPLDGPVDMGSHFGLNQRLPYELYGIVVHSGGWAQHGGRVPQSGHYYVFLRDRSSAYDREWCRYNDREVRTIYESDISALQYRSDSKARVLLFSRCATKMDSKEALLEPANLAFLGSADREMQQELVRFQDKCASINARTQIEVDRLCRQLAHARNALREQKDIQARLEREMAEERSEKALQIRERDQTIADLLKKLEENDRSMREMKNQIHQLMNGPTQEKHAPVVEKERDEVDETRPHAPNADLKKSGRRKSKSGKSKAREASIEEHRMELTTCEEQRPHYDHYDHDIYKLWPYNY